MSYLLLALSLTGAFSASPTPDAQSAAAANNQFALDLYGRLAARGGNVFFSPYSINKALAMAYAGARGDTAAEMAAVLHLPDDQEQAHRSFLEMRRLINRNFSGSLLSKPRVQMAQAAALWGQSGYGFQEPFLKRLDECYGARLNEVDFWAGDSARQTINAWVEKQTAGKVPQLFGPDTLGRSTRLVLASAIYYKGEWLSPFPKDSTRPEPFLVSRDRRADVPMMTQTDAFKYAEVAEGQMLEMPYDGKGLAMLVVLPRDVDGLAALEKSLTATQLAAWTSRLRQQQVQVSFPRFKMEGAFALPETLKALGMKTAFVQGEADFSGMNGGREPLWLGAVAHKAFVDVNELGTEATAATGVAVEGTIGLPQGPTVPVFRADHPFLFAIRDVQTGVILFLGRFVQP
jgi:serpin B